MKKLTDKKRTKEELFDLFKIMIKKEMEATNAAEKENPDAPDEEIYMIVRLKKQEVWDRMIVEHQVYNVELAIAATMYGFEDEPEVLAIRKSYEDEMIRVDNERAKAEGLGLTEDQEAFLNELL